jgi:hypothetical protein
VCFFAHFCFFFSFSAALGTLPLFLAGYFLPFLVVSFAFFFALLSVGFLFFCSCALFFRFCLFFILKISVFWTPYVLFLSFGFMSLVVPSLLFALQT